MVAVKSVEDLGNQLLVKLDDGTKVICYPTMGGFWLPRTGSTTPPVDPEDPPVDPPVGTGDLTDYFTGPHGISGGWDGHYTYSRGGTDWAMPVGTDLRAVAAGTIVNYPNIDGAGLKSMLVYDTAKVRKIAASTQVMDGGYVENPTANAVAFMYQHLSVQLEAKHYEMGDVIAKSGNTGQTTGPHLHGHQLATASVGGDRLDFMKFV